MEIGPDLAQVTEHEIGCPKTGTETDSESTLLDYDKTLRPPTFDVLEQPTPESRSERESGRGGGDRNDFASGMFSLLTKSLKAAQRQSAFIEAEIHHLASRRVEPGMGMFLCWSQNERVCDERLIGIKCSGLRA